MTFSRKKYFDVIWIFQPLKIFSPLYNPQSRLFDETDLEIANEHFKNSTSNEFFGEKTSPENLNFSTPHYPFYSFFHRLTTTNLHFSVKQSSNVQLYVSKFLRHIIFLERKYHHGIWAFQPCQPPLQLFSPSYAPRRNFF